MNKNFGTGLVVPRLEDFPNLCAEMFDSDKIRSLNQATRAAIEQGNALIKETQQTLLATPPTDRLMSMTWDELDRKDLLETLKANNINGFKLKFKQQFNRDYTG